MGTLRIAFVGQNGPVTLQLLDTVASRHDLCAVVESAPRFFNYEKYGTGPEAARRRRTRLWRLSRRRNVPFFFLSPSTHSDLARFLRENHIDLACVSSMSSLLKPSVLIAPRFGVIGFHPALLPKYRGPNPWFWQFQQMERESGVSIYFLDNGEDTGDIIYQEAFSVPLGMTFEDMQHQALVIGGRLMLAAADAISEERCPHHPQRHLRCPLRARGVRADEPLIDWGNWPIERVWHVLQGTTKWLKPLPLPTSVSSVGSRWRIGWPQRCRVMGQPGSVDQDKDGYFAVHPEGKIRLFLSD